LAKIFIRRSYSSAEAGIVFKSPIHTKKSLADCRLLAGTRQDTDQSGAIDKNAEHMEAVHEKIPTLVLALETPWA
jgi:hypothetical protein